MFIRYLVPSSVCFRPKIYHKYFYMPHAFDRNNFTIVTGALKGVGNPERQNFVDIYKSKYNNYDHNEWLDLTKEKQADKAFEITKAIGIEVYKKKHGLEGHSPGPGIRPPSMSDDTRKYLQQTLTNFKKLKLKGKQEDDVMRIRLATYQLVTFRNQESIPEKAKENQKTIEETASSTDPAPYISMPEPASCPAPTSGEEKIDTLPEIEITGTSETAQKIADNTSKGPTVKKTVDNVTKVASIDAASAGKGSTCLDKLKSLGDKLDLDDLSISDLAKKLGVEIKELLENGVEEIKEFFGELSPEEIEAKLKELFKDNIIYDALGEIKDLGTSIASGLSAGAGYIDSRIKKGIDSLKKKSFKELIVDLIELPFKATFAIIGGIADQLNKNLCNGNLLTNISDLLGDIDDGINFFTGLLSNKHLGDLLSGKLDSGVLAKLLRVGIIAATLRDRLSKDVLNGQIYVNAPTTLTTTRPSLSALLINNTVSPNLNGPASQGGLWDPDSVPPLSIQGFTVSSAFVVTGDAFNNISDGQIKSLLTEKYDTLYDSLDFDDPSSTPSLDIIPHSSKLSQNDVLFSIGITGDNSVGESEDIFTSILTLTYVIHKRIYTTDDECTQKLNTETILYDNVPFYGYGDNATESRNNAFAECKNKVINDVNSAKQGVVSYK